MREAAGKNGWQLNYGSIARMWRGGCIIRSSILDNIEQAFTMNPDLESLLFDDFFRQAIHKTQAGWRQVVAKAVELGVPVPAFSSALAFYDGYRCSRLPANLLQAQRDYFGAHTYERVDRPRREFFHTDWSGQ
jgi:6-phosphogluconate dehydrogenase